MHTCYHTKCHYTRTHTLHEAKLTQTCLILLLCTCRPKLSPTTLSQTVNAAPSLFSWAGKSCLYFLLFFWQQQHHTRWSQTPEQLAQNIFSLQQSSLLSLSCSSVCRYIAKILLSQYRHTMLLLMLPMMSWLLHWGNSFFILWIMKWFGAKTSQEGCNKKMWRQRIQTGRYVTELGWNENTRLVNVS